MTNKSRLVLIMSPDTFDRGTEKPFQDLFSELQFVAPANWKDIKDYENPVPRENDVLLFEGGTDISSELYKQAKGPNTQTPDVTRDKHEVRYFEHAKKVKAGMIGICRGAQLLCALNGGEIIQHVHGHNNNRHKIQLPKCFQGKFIETTSAHHQMMNPYQLEENKDWYSLGHCPYPQSSGKYFGPNGRVKVDRTYGDFKEQEIIWFPKTRSLAIQGHPEYLINTPTHPFIQYCRMLVKILLLGEKSRYDLLAR